MKVFRLLNCVLSIIFLASCSQEEIVKPSYTDKGSNRFIAEEEIIFESPKIRSLAKENTIRLKSIPSDNVEDWLVDENELKDLGYSYWFEGEELIEQELKDPVINVRTLIKDPALEGSVSISTKRKVEIQTQAFRDYRHTLTENRRFSKIDGGSKFNLFGLVKLFDFTSSYEKTFYHQNKDFDTSLFGEANVYVYGKDVSLSNNIATRAGIIERHLYPNFIRTLYSSPMGIISSSVGPLVLCKYRLGGKLSAKYLYRKKEHESLDSLYSHFKMGLDLTFKPSGENAPSAGVHYNNNSFFKLLENKEDQQFYASLKTIGGVPKFQVNLPVLSKGNIPSKIDVSSWISSLSDMKTHTIVDIQDDGLLPISDFILESNFRLRLMDIYKGVLEANTENQTPKIEVSNVYVRHSESGEVLCDIALVLNTRNEDKLILTNVNEKASDDELLLNKSRDEFIRKGRQLVASVSHVFKGIKKSGKPNKILSPYLRTTLCTNAVIDFNRLKKYQNPYTKVVYLYDEESKVALSYYRGEGGDINLEEEYGLTDFVRNLPEKKISILNLLQDYHVLGL